MCENLCFPFITKTLNDLLSFRIYLLNDNNKEFTFVKKIWNKCAFMVNRKLRPTKPNQLIKEEQINFLIEVENNLKEYKKAIRLKDKQLSGIKKYFTGG